MARIHTACNAVMSCRMARSNVRQTTRSAQQCCGAFVNRSFTGRSNHRDAAVYDYRPHLERGALVNKDTNKSNSTPRDKRWATRAVTINRRDAVRKLREAGYRVTELRK